MDKKTDFVQGKGLGTSGGRGRNKERKDV